LTPCFGLARPSSGRNVVHNGEKIHNCLYTGLLCIFSPLCTTLRPEDGRARPKHVVKSAIKYETKTVVFLNGPHLLLLIYNRYFKEFLFLKGTL
jgi:hypothetical protein